MPDEMTWIAPVYLRLLVQRAASHPDAPEDPVLTNEALEYALKALDGNVPPPEPKDPALPPGEYARVEIMGHDYETGWVTDGMRAGVPVLVIRDWDGRVLREVPGQSLYQFVPLATPLKRPEQPKALSGPGPRPDFGGDAWMPATDAEPDAYAGNDDDEEGPF